MDLSAFQESVASSDGHSVLVDCTASEAVPQQYAKSVPNPPAESPQQEACLLEFLSTPCPSKMLLTDWINRLINIDMGLEKDLRDGRGRGKPLTVNCFCATYPH